ncbi:MAG: carbamoyltransferase HypF [Saprospiraceae bacterium]
MNTWYIRISGQVQGVGFRPFVANAARSCGLKGWVSNGLNGLEICINATAEDAGIFYKKLTECPPDGALITDAALETAPDAFFDTFSIHESLHEGAPNLLVTPDVAICTACREELYQSDNRRFEYPFTTCASCGPRYSVITALPYDRSNTTMQPFPLCPSCASEYEDCEDRRYFAQTNSCPVCGIEMQLIDVQASQACVSDQKQILDRVPDLWRAGAIVALKGVGGYLLTCDATRSGAVATLRARKRRPTKPFALMYPDAATLEGDARLDPETRAWLSHPAAPVVLLPVRELPASGLDLAGVAPGLDTIGVMLPYAPLFDLLLRRFGKPVVATSGNVSGIPIVYEEGKLSDLAPVADYYLSHNREIAVPQDDSVVAVAGNQPVFLRRSRGLAPTLLVKGLKTDSRNRLALGAELKSTFTLGYQSNLFVSQYWGDLGDFDTQNRFEKYLLRTLDLLQVTPAEILGDLHPGYFSTRLGQEMSEKREVPFRQIQHHKAHFAAVLAENDLFNCKEPVLGVIWDGTGLGEDGQIWGGEFFLYQRGDMQRIAHLPWFTQLLADKMPREPRLSALSWLGACEGAERLLRPLFTEREWGLYQKMRDDQNALKTSSAGRVFDGVAALLGLPAVQHYEGEAATKLETLARSFVATHHPDVIKYAYPAVWSGSAPANDDWKQELLEDISAGQSPACAAARFHLTLCAMIDRVASHWGVGRVAFSGGVFQNTLLVRLLQYHLETRYRLHFHRQLSPNDENISFGQWVYGLYFK